MFSGSNHKERKTPMYIYAKCKTVQVMSSQMYEIAKLGTKIMWKKKDPQKKCNSLKCNAERPQRGKTEKLHTQGSESHRSAHVMKLLFHFTLFFPPLLLRFPNTARFHVSCRFGAAASASPGRGFTRFTPSLRGEQGRLSGRDKEPHCDTSLHLKVQRTTATHVRDSTSCFSLQI